MKEVSIRFDLTDVREFLIQKARERGLQVPDDAYVGFDNQQVANQAVFLWTGQPYQGTPAGLRLFWFPQP